MEKIIIPVLNGDGISDEIIAQVKRTVEKAMTVYSDRQIEWLDFTCGERFEGGGIPDEAFEAVRKYRVGIKGPMTTPIGKGYTSLNVHLRKVLNLYACVRPVKYYPGAPSPIKNPEGIDMVIVRENTEDLYGTPEFTYNDPQFYSLLEILQNYDEENNYHHSNEFGVSCKIISAEATRQITSFAMEYAVEHKRKKIDLVTKANIIRATDGLFLKIGTDHLNKLSSRQGLTHGSLLVDNATQQMVINPQQFDMLVMPNLYGDILSDLAAGIVGGLGYAPGANIGDSCAVFEATHGTWPQGAGKNIANPIALILSAKMMLEYLNLNEAAEILEKAVSETIAYFSNKKISTSDIGDWIRRDIEYLKNKTTV